MKPPAPVLVVLSALLLLGTSLPSMAFESVRLQSRSYIRLGDWARHHGFQLFRTPTSREVLVTNASIRLVFRIDGSRIEINDVGFWLSYPILLSESQAHVSEQDLRGVLDPITRPRKWVAGGKIRTICLDPGHGGKEPGQKLGSRLEKTYTLALALEVRSLLVQQGYQVLLTRRDDTYVDHAERTAIAKRAGADLFVSLHYNAAADAGSDANGVEVYAMTPEGAKSTNFSTDIGSLKAWAGNASDAHNVLLAFQIQKALLKRLPGTEDRGVRRARFQVLRLAEMPAVLIEGGFMSNASDARWIYSDTGRKKMAEAIVDGIGTFKRQVEPKPVRTPQRSTSSTSSSRTARPESASN